MLMIISTYMMYAMDFIRCMSEKIVVITEYFSRIINGDGFDSTTHCIKSVLHPFISNIVISFLNAFLIKIYTS